MKRNPKVTIIIPLHVINERFFEDIKKFKKLHYRNYEILVVTDRKIKNSLPFLKLIYSKKRLTGPAEKRDIAIRYAKGRFCAFIDDDAYPDKYWLDKAIPNFFHNKEIVAVGGPGVTPSEDDYWEKISGLAYESFFCSGAAQNRFVPLLASYVEDWPAYNLIVKTSVLKKVGGYGSHFYGGEDTFLCSKLIKLGKIYYDPGALIYHHKRSVFAGLLDQIANIGLHRGYFAKKFPKTSRKLFYFFPSLMTLGLLLYILLVLVFPSLFPLFLVSLSFFVLLGMISIMDRTVIINSFLVGLIIILVHLTYGTFFMKGLLTTRLKR